MKTSPSARFTPQPLALAAAAALLFGAQTPAAAQSFTQSGANSTSPNNLLPFVGNPSSLDFTGDTIFIGNSAAGSFSAIAGALLKADALSIANGNTGAGSVLFTGAGTKAEFGGSGNRLEVGNWGVGTMTVSAGALVDATVNAAACGTCSTFVGNGAGSTGTLTVTGAGSELRTLRNFTVAQSSVFTQAASGFEFGTPGGTTNAVVSVMAGGSLRTEQAVVGSNNASPDGLGTEKAFGTVAVSGAGSQWLLTHNSIDNLAAGLTVGSRAGGTGNVIVSDGGKLRIDGSAGPGPNDFLNIASNGGTGSLTVTGTGSSVDLVGFNTVLQVGRSGAGAQGSFSVLAGATASTLFANIGRDAASGTMTISGAGSQLNQIGVGTNQSPGSNGAAFANIGRDGGSGQVTVSDGARWFISDGGGDARAAEGGPGFLLGRGLNGSGSVLITGTGSVIEVVSNSVNPAPGVADNYNAFVAIGYDNAATSSGTLTVSDGGKLILTGNSLSTVTHGRATTLNVGGRSGVAGTGTATVTGAGSEIIVGGFDTLINVGRTAGGSGTLNVLDQAKVSAISMVVGHETSGTVNVDNAQIALSGFRTDSSAVGAATTIGRGVGGIGALNLSNGATLTITPQTLTGGIAVGGDQFFSGGTGTVSLSGGSSIVIGGPLAGNGFGVGRSGTGILALSQASFVDVAAGTVDFGREATAVGTLSLSGGSSLRANQVDIGGRSDSVAGGSATATVTGSGSALRAIGDTGFISVGRGGIGSLGVTNLGALNATVLNIGRAAGGVGTLTVDNATLVLSGQQSAGSQSGASFTVGNRGGNGTANIGNGSVVTISNAGSDGAHLNVGGTAINPLGTGVLNVSGASRIALSAAAGKASVNIGRDGTGTAALSGGSSLDAGDGTVYVARLPGSTGTLTLGGGSTLTAGFVGVGVSRPFDGSTQATGGSGKLILNDGTINADMFELGATSTLSGSNGVFNVTGDIVIGGTVAPGNSPGRLRWNCNVITLAGSKLLLEVDDIGGGNYAFDELIIDQDSTFDLQQLNIVFQFADDTDPQAAFSPTGGQLALDSFLRGGVGSGDVAFSTVFGSDWNALVNAARITAESKTFNISEFKLDPSSPSGGFTVVATPVPEPATWALSFSGLLALGGYARWRKRAGRES
jgi:T5SS/PEP-CTERM-associated repeat protein